MKLNSNVTMLHTIKKENVSLHISPEYPKLSCTLLQKIAKIPPSIGNDNDLAKFLYRRLDTNVGLLGGD